ncbi:MAG: 50S ribosomal protein L17 [Balneolaceae bacterium]
MRHSVKGRKLNRTASHRKATLQALSVGLIMDRRMTTTVAKAKELRRFIEPLITRAKVDNQINRRVIFAAIQDKYAVQELFEEVGPMTKDRPGGYTRVIKAGYRSGDSAETAIIELVDYNDVSPDEGKEKKRKTRRAGRSKKSGTAAQAVSDPEKSVNEGESKTAADKASVASSPESGSAESSASKTEKESSDDAGSMTVSEAKEKLESMSAEEAKTFVGDDERVTLQKALQKKIEEEEEEK